jgi:hypothetical protein
MTKLKKACSKPKLNVMKSRLFTLGVAPLAVGAATVNEW